MVKEKQSLQIKIIFSVSWGKSALEMVLYTIRHFATVIVGTWLQMEKDVSG